MTSGERVRVKLCGMTRAADVAGAVEAGADYVGVIFAGGTRNLTPAMAQEVVAPAAGRVPVVGVFGAVEAREIGTVARAVGLSAVQLHGDPSPALVTAVRSEFGGEVWAVRRLAQPALDEAVAALCAVADMVVLDAYAPHTLGGTGTPLDWPTLGRALAGRPERQQVVLAGGLRPTNVAAAIAAVRPAVVDVSSGIERAPGMKDHESMRAFVRAARSAVDAGERGR